MAMYVSGIVKGIRVDERIDKDSGEVKPRYFVGFADMVPDAYDQRERITEVRISDKLAKTGLQAKFEALKGKECMVEIFDMPNAFKGKVYKNYYFAGDGLPFPVPARKQA